jgi:hypothetical protein
MSFEHDFNRLDENQTVTQGVILRIEKNRSSNGNNVVADVLDGNHQLAMMANRGDRRHDIAAWFGLNQGRIKNTQDGKYGPPHTTPGLALPPKGPPGRRWRPLGLPYQILDMRVWVNQHDADLEGDRPTQNGQ